MNITWNKKNTPKELYSLLETLSEEFQITNDNNGTELAFIKDKDENHVMVTRKEEVFEIHYGSLRTAARGISYAMSAQECNEKIPFRTFGILLDCSRTGVVTVSHFKRWLRRLCLFGYNFAMIYVKDAYQLPGEPYFGYMRGAYSMDEIREIDAYAKKLGIEIAASIQVLGHVEPLRRGGFENVMDTPSVLLVDSEATYVLIEKMINFWSSALDSRRIHIGMDETHDLGLGRFLALHGYENPLDIYTRHLKRVCDICAKYSLRPIIWNDMFFRYSNKNHAYYVPDAVVPDYIRKAIPDSVELNYWDYYYPNRKHYTEMLVASKQLNGKIPIMAAGVWTWNRLWTDFYQTCRTASPCIDACREFGVEDFIFTMWSDDGGYCEFDSAFASLAWASDYAFNLEYSAERTRRLYKSVCGGDYDLQADLGFMCLAHYEGPEENHYGINGDCVLWDDPVMGMYYSELESRRNGILDEALVTYKRLQEKAALHRDDNSAGRVDYAWHILNVLVRKLEIRKKLLASYKKHDTEMLKELTKSDIPAIVDALKALSDAYRIQYMRSYKPYGLEIMQIRLAGIEERFNELGRRIESLLDGSVKVIEELEHDFERKGFNWQCYDFLATGGWYV